jgi:hypothetical protein
MKDVRAGLSLVRVRPPLCDVVVVILYERETGVVKVSRRLHAGHSDEGKSHTLFQTAWNARHHLRLVARGTVVRCDQAIAVNGEHRNHCPGRRISGLHVLHERRSIPGQRVRHRDPYAVLSAFPLAGEC